MWCLIFGLGMWTFQTCCLLASAYCHLLIWATFSHKNRPTFSTALQSCNGRVNSTEDCQCSFWWMNLSCCFSFALTHNYTFSNFIDLFWRISHLYLSDNNVYLLILRALVLLVHCRWLIHQNDGKWRLGKLSGPSLILIYSYHLYYWNYDFFYLTFTYIYIYISLPYQHLFCSFSNIDFLLYWYSFSFWSR